MNDLIGLLIGLVVLLAIAAVLGRPFINNSTLIAWIDGDLYEEGDA